MKKHLTEIIFLLDRSGSMGGLESDTIGGFNAFIEKQRQFKGDTLVTTVLFDDQYDVLWNGIEAKYARLTKDDYIVRGGTALLDAIGMTINDVGNRLSNTFDYETPNKVIFVITTDGMENASREFTYEKVNEMIHHQQEKYSWEFIFLGANIDTIQEANRIGIDEDNAFNFESSKHGVEEMYDRVCEVVIEKRVQG